MGPTNREYIGRALDAMAAGLEPYIRRIIADAAPGVEWTKVLEFKDHQEHRDSDRYRATDPQVQLRMLTERLGNLGFPFNLPPECRAYASEMRQVRNLWAHNEPFTDDDVLRYLDTAARLLGSIGADTSADQVKDMLREIRNTPELSEQGGAAKAEAQHLVPEGQDGESEPDEPGIGRTQNQDIEIFFEASADLSYAMAYNGRRIISRLTILNHGPDVHGAVLTLEVNGESGSVSRPSEHYLDLPADKEITLTDLDLQADPASMLQLQDRQQGTVRARVSADGADVAEKTVDIELLAAHHWIGRPVLLALESLAAFVQPNHPEIAKLCSEASDLLKSTTGDGSLEGYQSGPDRADAIVEALFRAMKRRDIRYSEPPASWGQYAQRIRTAEEVLAGRFGTCMDTAVVLAAALEFCGLQANLWLVKGHIFLGYWRDEANFRTPAVEEPQLLVNAIDMGRIRLVETTKVAHPGDCSMDELHDGPYARYLTGEMDEVYGVVDIYGARYAGIRPIPARFKTEDGEVAVVEYVPERHNVSRSPSARSDGATGRRSDSDRPDMPARISQWKNALLDLSLRNRLINFTKTARFPLAVPDDRAGEFEDMINAGTSVTLLPSDDVSAMQAARGVRFGRDLPQDQLADLLINQKAVFAETTVDAYQSRMRNLAYKAKTLVEETGANNLYLALGSLVWTLDGRELRSPLILVPARLRPTSKQGNYTISVDDAGSSTPNYCLLEKLRLTHGLNIPGMAEPAEDGSGIDLDAAFNAVRSAVAEKALPFRVEPTVDLSILQFAKFRLWKDLDENWEAFTHNALVKHLVHTPTDGFTDPITGTPDVDIDELATKVPIPADSSQLQAIAEATSEKTFVLEGPPGTGKSQTITNLLTRAIAEGKRVLFVAEKRAALDVVQKRLNDVGMGVFSLDLHDKGSKPAAVRAQIKAALDHTAYPDRQGLDAALGDLNNARRNLVRYASRLHDENGAELSLYTARTQELAVGEDIQPLQIPESFAEAVTVDSLQPLRKQLSELPDTAEPAAPGNDHPWGFIDVPVTAGEEAVIAASASRLQTALDGLAASADLFQVLLAARTPADLTKLATLLRSGKVDVGVLDEVNTARWTEATHALKGNLAAFAAASHPGLDVVIPDALNLPIADIHAQAVAAAESGFFGRKKRLIAVRDQLAPVTRPGMVINPKKVPELTGALMNVQGAVRGLAGGAQSIPGIALPASWNPLTEAGQQYLEHNVQWLEWAAALVKVEGEPDSTEFMPMLRAFLHAEPSVDNSSAEAVDAIAKAATDLFAAARMTDQNVETWCGDESLLARWEHTARRRDLGKDGTPSLRRWLAFISQLEMLRTPALTEAREQLKLGRVDANDAARAFERGLALASRHERAVTTGLDRFEPRSHEKVIGRFGDRSGVVREHLKTALPDDVLKSRRFNSESTSGQMGLLQRQLNYKSGGLRVRPLMEKHGSLITRIMPCVLVSPDSVARFFPAQADLFDMVVFDEASQIRVADAVGAMGRGRAVVVVGDSKQMPPTSFAETTTEKDEDTELANETVEDEESILSECVIARVPRQWLSWHYRSQEESLIAFSNQQYYENKLSSFPAPVHGAPSPAVSGHGINFIRVDGHFHRSGAGKLLRTNPVEAEAVVGDIRRRFEASPDGHPSVGVVTFNLQQRAHIESLLRDSDDPRIGESLDDPEGIFVKNLENVQGDERNTILFSTGFSKNDRGYLPLNFGPLNRSGGERRLNVAVTRARRQVIVFSSFDPRDLREDETSSVGIKHLRSYLDLAANGTGSLPHDRRRKPAIDRHREQVAEALRERGLTVTTDVGLSDFKVDLSVALPENPQRPVMAVLLDSPAWAARGTVGDRDGLPTEVLSRMLRWPAVERVWLPEWLTDSGSVVDRLEEAARREDEVFEAEDPDAAVEPGESIEIPDSDGGASVETPDAEPSTKASDVLEALQEDELEVVRSIPPTATTATRYERYSPWQLRGAGDIDVLNTLTTSRRSREAVAAVIDEVVEAEGPIHTDRLAKLVCAEFSLNKVNSQRASSVIRQLDRKRLRVDSESFVWPLERDAGTWTGYRTNDQSVERKIEHVSRVEIANAMADICQASGGIDWEELKRHTIRAFGGKRLTKGITDRLEIALREAVRFKKLAIDDSGFIVAV